MKKKSLILTAACAALIMTASIGSAFAYFSTYERAMGGYAIHLGHYEEIPEEFLDVEPKPPVLWIRGDDDQVVSDNSMLEFGNLGRIGMIPGWPGEEVYPPQPMVKQTRYFLDQYRSRGGSYIELVIPGGHVCILESPMQFVTALDAFVAV